MLESGSAYENTRTYFQSTNVQLQASLQPRVCRGSPSRRCCLFPPLCRSVCGEEVTVHHLLCHGRTQGQIKQEHDFDLVAQSQELGSFLCAGGRESIHRSCDAAPSLPQPWQLQHYKEPSTSTCCCQPLPSTQRLQAGVVWSVDGLICKPKPFGAPYSSHFLPLSGCMCLAVWTFLSRHEHFLKEAAILQQTSNASWYLSRKIQNSLSLAVWIGLALLLLVNLLQNLQFGTKKHLHASPLSGRSALAEGREFWVCLVFRHVLRQIESKHWEIRSLLVGLNPCQSTDFHLRGCRYIHNYNLVLLAVLLQWADVWTTMKNHSKSIDDLKSIIYN